MTVAGVSIDFPFPPSVPSRGQWQSYFAQCQPVLDYVPLDNAGDTMRGTLSFAPGVAPQLDLILVADLPSPGPGNVGQVFAVSDANSPAWNQPVMGGGTTTCLAVSDGVAWRAG